MTKYRIEVTEVLSRIVETDAENEDEAVEMASTLTLRIEPAFARHSSSALSSSNSVTRQNANEFASALAAPSFGSALT